MPCGLISLLLITSTSGSTVTGYTWIRKTHISGLTPVSGEEDPATSLYKITFDTNDSDRNALPSVTLVDENWWGLNTIPFGAFGSVAKGWCRLSLRSTV